MAATDPARDEAAKLPGREAIDVVCPAPRDVSPVQLDRFLFSVAMQSHPLLHVTVVLDRDATVGAVRQAEAFDWSRLPRPPAIATYPRESLGEAGRLAFALARADRRRVAIVDVRGTLYARALELLAETATATKAAIVFGDASVKEVQAFATFTREVKRHYLCALPSGAEQLRAGWLPPLAACLLDRDRIARADLALDEAGDADEAALVFRLFSRYPARAVALRVPLYARERLGSAEAGAAQLKEGGRRALTDRVALAVREWRLKFPG